MVFGKKYGVVLIPVLFLSLFISQNAQARFDGESSGNLTCIRRGYSDSKTCNVDFENPDNVHFKAYRTSFGGGVDGYGSTGKYILTVCLSQTGQMWNGPCWEVARNNELDDGYDYIGDSKQLGIGDWADWDFNFATYEAYVMDAGMDITTVRVAGYVVSIDSFNTSRSSAEVGQSFTISWNTDAAWAGTRLTYNVPCYGSGTWGVGANDSRTFTAGCTGTATFTLCAEGDGHNGHTTVCTDGSAHVDTWTPSSINMTITQPKPGAFTLNNTSCNSGRVNLSWSASLYATSYEIWEKFWTSGSWHQLDTISGTSYTSYPPLNTGTYYFIRARNSSGYTDSNEIGVTCVGPSADIKANSSDGPISIEYNSSATISWTSTVMSSCTVSPNGWTGTSGSQSTGNLTESQTYGLNCTGSEGSRSDSVTVQVIPLPVPTADLKCNL